MSQRREQRQKVERGENKDWMRARLDQSNRNLTVPSKKPYRREKAGARNRWSDE